MADAVLSPIAAPAELTFVNVSAFVLEAVGEIDRRFQGAAGEPADASVDVDLALLSHFDSAAIAGLVAIERRAQARALRVRFLNATPNLRKLASLYAVDGLIFRD